MRSRRSLKVSHTQTSVPCGTLNYTGWQSQLNNFFIQFVSLLVTPLPLICLNVLLGLTFVCLSVPPHIENNLPV